MRALAGPEVDDDEAAMIIAELVPAAVDIGEVKFGCGSVQVHAEDYILAAC
jgi:hypothetical protein